MVGINIAENLGCQTPDETGQEAEKKGKGIAMSSLGL